MASAVHLHRVLRADPARVYRAFTDPDAIVKWLPPHGFTAHVHRMEVREGGEWRMSFTSLATGEGHTFGGIYLELVPGERLRYTDVFDDPGLPGTMETTLSLKKVPLGTDLTVVQTGIPDAIPVEACHLGWQESLALLALLVEAGA